MSVITRAFFAFALLIPLIACNDTNVREAAVPELVPRDSGEFEVRMPGSGCTALYDKRGGLITRGSSCSASERSQADDAARRWVREQGM